MFVAFLFILEWTEPSFAKGKGTMQHFINHCNGYEIAIMSKVIDRLLQKLIQSMIRENVIYFPAQLKIECKEQLHVKYIPFFVRATKKNRFWH